MNHSRIFNSLKCPKWIIDNTQYLVIMGSQSYGVSTDESDYDFYGFTIPSKEDIFPHLKGYIHGFGENHKGFETYQQHGFEDTSSGKPCDFTIYSIVKFFDLCMKNNPNMIDSLFVPDNCIVRYSPIGNLVRENRHLFLHKGCYQRFKSYAYQQLNKIRNKKPSGKRDAVVERFGYDVKYAYNLVRLINEVEQILIEGTLDLQRSKEQLKDIRNGGWELSRVEQYFRDKERHLEEAYHKSDLPAVPDDRAIKSLLLECLTLHFGSLEGSIVDRGKYEGALRSISKICNDILRGS